MRLMFLVAAHAPGGAERHAQMLMEALRARGHSVRMITAKRALVAATTLPPGADTWTLDARHYVDLRAARTLGTMLAGWRPDVLVAVNAWPLALALVARHHVASPVKLLTIFHSTRLRNWRERLKLLPEALALRAADRLVFVSAEQRAHWQRRGVAARATCVIHNGVDLARFAPEALPNRAEARRQLGLPPQDFIVAMVAILRPEKNPAQLVEAVHRLRLRGVPASALFIGDGPERARVETQAQALGGAAQVRITGVLEDVRLPVAAADVVVLCSRTEALSFAAIEAMAMARPLVHTRVGGAPELVLPGYNGFLFPPGDTAGLVDALYRLAQRDVAATMGRHARAVASALFGHTTMVDAYEQTLRELLARQPASLPSHPPMEAPRT